MAFNLNDIKPVDPAIWEKMAAEIAASGGGGDFFSLKEGKTRLRLVPMDARGTFFHETTRTYRGQSRTKYLISAIILATPKGGDLGDGLKDKVKFIAVAKQTITAIIGLLAEGYDLLSPEGKGITIVRTGSGLDTSYTVMASPKAVPYPKDLKMPEKTFAQIAEEFATQSLERDEQQKNKGKTETSAKGSADGEEW